MVYRRSIAMGVCLMAMVVLYSGLMFYLSLGKFGDKLLLDYYYYYY